MKAGAARPLRPMTVEQRRQVKAALDRLEAEIAGLETRLGALEADIEKKRAERENPSQS